MLKRNFASVEGQIRSHLLVAILGLTLLIGCATPQYAVRPTPVPDESPSVLEFEYAISARQAQEFEKQGARSIMPREALWGLDIQVIIEQLGRVTERPHLLYQAFLYHDADPNAAALADGSVYLSSGMLDYLASRGSIPDELAFVVAHELAHTSAQHLVQRYRALKQQQLIMTVVAAGAAVATQGASSGAQQMGSLAVDAASLLNNLAKSGYSQTQELEADQLGIRYVIRAGFNPQATLNLLADFTRFEEPWPFFRTHPYTTQRHADLARYLTEQGTLRSNQSMRSSVAETAEDRARQLRKVQKLYPVGSQSWKNLQQQIERLER